MTEKKYVVPEGMLDAAYGYARLENSPASRDHYRAVLKAALRWFSENPIVPTDEQLQNLRADVQLDPIGKPNAMAAYHRGMVVEWQRRMFLAPESAELSDDQIREKVSDLLRPENGWYTSMIAAFRRGHKEGKQ